jgi:hypothetical protein
MLSYTENLNLPYTNNTGLYAIPRNSPSQRSEYYSTVSPQCRDLAPSTHQPHPRGMPSKETDNPLDPPFTPCFYLQNYLNRCQHTEFNLSGNSGGCSLVNGQPWVERLSDNPGFGRRNGIQGLASDMA